MYKLLSRYLTQSTISPLFQGHALSIISTTLVLSVLLSACGGGGGGGAETTPAPALTLSVSSSNLTVKEDFADFSIATVANATGLTVSQSTQSVVTVTTSVTGVRISSIANANGRTTLTITASNGASSTTSQVVVQVTAVNDAPILSISTAALTLTEDFATTVSIAVTSTDVEDDTLTLSVTESTAGVVTVTTSASGIRVSSSANANGRTTLTITVNDGTTNTSIQVAVTVRAVNDLPTLTVSTNNISTTGGFSPITIGTTASDAEDGVLTFAVQVSTTGVVRVTTSANAIVLSPFSGVSGQTTLTVRTTDSAGVTAIQTIAVNVIIVPSTAIPTLSVSTALISVREDFMTSLVIRTTATDADGDAITLSVSSSTRLVDAVISTLINGMSTITLIAGANLNGTATLIVRATDVGGQSTSAEIVVQVAAVNDAPTLTISTTALMLTEDFAMIVPITLTSSDVEGDTLTLSVTESTTSVITVTTSASGIRVSSIANANGVTTLTITVSDGSLSSTAQAVVTVNAVNDPPILTVSTNALTLTEDFAGFSTIATAIDVDGNALTFSVTESTTRVVTVTTSASDVRVSSIANANGRTTLIITVNDGVLSSTAQVVVTVNAVNDPPILTVSTNNISTNGGFSPITIRTTASDAEDDVLTFSVQVSTTGVVRVTTSANAIVLNTISNASGQTILTVRTTDSAGLTAVQAIAVNVSIVSSVTPVLTVSTNGISVREDFTTSLVIRTTATDADGDTITLSVSSLTRLVDAVISTLTNGMSTITLTSVANLNGTATLTVRATDVGGQSTSAEIVVTVTAINDPPTLAVSTTALTLTEDFAGFSTVATAIDVDGNALTFSVAESTTGVITVTTSASDVHVSSIVNANGRTTLTITVSDGTTNTSTQVVVTVNAVNDPPILTVSAIVLTLTEDFATTVSITATSSDVENDTLTLSVTESPSGIVSVVATTNTVDVSSILNANGRTVLTITVSDGTTNTSTQVAVTVNAVNDVPILAVLANPLTLNEDFVDIKTIAIATDFDGTALTLSVTQSSTEVITVTTSASGVFVSSSANANGQTTLTITVNDGTTKTSTQIAVTVNAVNDAPTLTVSTTALTLTEDFVTTVSIAVTSSDVEGDTLTLSVTESTTGVVTVTTSASGVRVSSSANANGRTTLTITVNDGTTNTSTQVAVTVNAVNDAPTLTVSTTALTLTEDFVTTVSIAVTSSDVEGDILTLSVIESTTGVITVTTSASDVRVSSSANANGRTTLTITVNDGTLNTSTQVVVTVNAVNDPPILTVSTTALTVTEDFVTTISIAVTSSDVEGDTLTLSVTESTTGVVTVTTSASGVRVSSSANANGRTTLTITVNDGTTNTSTQVAVTVNAVNDAPTLTVSTTALTLTEDFVTTVSIAVTSSDVEGDTLTLSVTESTIGVVTVTTSASGVRVSSNANANGRTTLTITVNDGTTNTSTQVAVTVNAVNDAPTLTVSTTALTLTEDFVTTVSIAVTSSDVEGDTLTLSVTESTTGVVTVTTSASGVRVSSSANANGRTTLTITVNDGTTNTSTQVAVAVNAVNDTPTLIVSSRTVTLSLAPVVLSVSAFDVEDGILSFSVSTGQGIVNTAITTTNLTITRLRTSTTQVMLTLRTTDSAGLTTSTIITVVPTPLFVITTGIKTLDFAWDAIPTATHYRLQSNPDGVSGFVDLSTTGIVVSPNSTTISQTTAQALVSLHRYIPRVSNPQYGVETCDATSCGSSFRHNTVALTNAQLNSLIGRLQASNAGLGDRFGESVSLSGDGNMLAVGARNEDSSSTGVNGAQNNASAAGAVYVFRFSGGAWSQQAYIKASNTGALDSFGLSVSLSGDGNTLAVGANNEDGSSTGVNGAQNDNNAFDSGAVYVFRFSGGVWSQQVYIKASNTEAGDRFGYTNLSGDGNTLAVGARFEDSSSTGVNGAQDDNNARNSGAVYVFRFSGGVWSQQAYIKASNPELNDNFGASVSLSGDGNILAVGAHKEDGSSTGVNGTQDNSVRNSGAVYVFRFSSGVWSQQAYIKASNAEAGDTFGVSVGLSRDGNTLAVGAVEEASSSTGVNGAQNNNNSTNTGAVYVFRFSGGVWSQQAYIKASNTGLNDQFGWSVGLSRDGNTLAVGAINEAGSFIGVNGAQNNNSVSDAGAAYVFEFSNGIWAQQAYIKASDPSVDAHFGTSVSLSSDGGSVAVGAPGVSNDTGVIYLY